MEELTALRAARAARKDPAPELNRLRLRRAFRKRLGRTPNATEESILTDYETTGRLQTTGLDESLAPDLIEIVKGYRPAPLRKSDPGATEEKSFHDHVEDFRDWGSDKLLTGAKRVMQTLGSPVENLMDIGQKAGEGNVGGAALDLINPYFHAKRAYENISGKRESNLPQKAELLETQLPEVTKPLNFLLSGGFSALSEETKQKMREKVPDLFLPGGLLRAGGGVSETTGAIAAAGDVTNLLPAGAVGALGKGLLKRFSKEAAESAAEQILKRVATAKSVPEIPVAKFVNPPPPEAVMSPFKNKQGYPAFGDDILERLETGEVTGGISGGAPGAVPPKAKPLIPKPAPSAAPTYVSPLPETARGIKAESSSPWNKAKEVLTTIKNQATRTFEHLPHGGKFGPVIDELTRLKKSSGIAADRTIRDLAGLTDGLSPDDYKMLADKAIFDDFTQDINRGLEEIPFYGKDHAKFAADKAALDAKFSARPDLAQRLEKRKAIYQGVKDEYVSALDEIGLDVSHIQNRDDYFRHLVLEHAQPGTQMGGKLKTPAGRGFLKGREGTGKAINTDLIQADFDVIAKMRRDIDSARAIKLIRDQHDIAPKLAAEAKAAGVPLSDAIPEGYVEWSPGQGHPFDIGTTKGAQKTQKVLDEALKLAGVDPKAAKLKNLQMVIPEEVAKTLEGMASKKSVESYPVYGLLKGATTHVKQWLLGRPSNFVDYNLRNLTGDAEAIFVGNPSAFKKLPQAAAELRSPIWKKGPATGEVAEWMNRGGLSGQQVAELGELAELPAFKALEKGDNLSKFNPLRYVSKGVRGYWDITRKITDWREAATRYAAYLDYLDQLKAGKLKNYGASIPAEVDALTNPRDKAFKLSNELLGGYDRTSVTGARIADVAIPFWRWNEVNATRTFQMLKNAVADGKLTSTIGKKLGAKSVGAAVGAGRFFLKGSAVMAALYAYNNTVWKDEENDLDDFTRSKPHIILGRDDKGRVRVLDGLGMMGDLLSWVGMDKNIPVVKDWINGRTSFMNVAKEVAKAPANRVVNSINPIVKLPVEQAFGVTSYPDVFNARPIRDRGEHLAGQFALQDEYAALAGKPSEGYFKKKLSFLGRGVDPGASAYNDIRSRKYRFLKSKGVEGFSGSPTPKSNALYEYKKALRYVDEEAAKKYLAEWESLGGDLGKLDKALAEAGPLGGLTNKQEAEFLQSLTPEELRKLERAQKYWDDVSVGGSEPVAQAPAPASSPAPKGGLSPQEELELLRLQRARRKRKAAGK